MIETFSTMEETLALITKPTSASSQRRIIPLSLVISDLSP
jgi:hypothetical protein